ncbi:hypothetical protein BV898_01965 [Hypsibius exemplaris]|uniref:Uncharacterized protein n=1 Tax=Hypsibius exemplaris TaxID=2072580 RepID=A0A1W0X908_HYPEX|nr:hypothetical protein BV898_01965 [Hypsibius exemplaris]
MAGNFLRFGSIFLLSTLLALLLIVQCTATPSRPNIAPAANDADQTAQKLKDLLLFLERSNVTDLLKPIGNRIEKQTRDGLFGSEEGGLGGLLQLLSKLQSLQTLLGLLSPPAPAPAQGSGAEPPKPGAADPAEPAPPASPPATPGLTLQQLIGLLGLGGPGLLGGGSDDADGNAVGYDARLTSN